MGDGYCDQHLLSIDGLEQKSPRRKNADIIQEEYLLSYEKLSMPIWMVIESFSVCYNRSPYQVSAETKIPRHLVEGFLGFSTCGNVRVRGKPTHRKTYTLRDNHARSRE